ncbi:MAG: hypothetical protein CMF62_12455 [Magnetococcales bacterium]|nr:hypothetical protein [Magnetococcales bacterium]|tara:strand:- start:169870 stop:170553 length:684 start_codon:yes stop_codon:yes gene_type:complete
MTGFMIDLVLMLTMAGLLGVVLVLHFKLKEFGRDAMRVPALADDLTTAITTSRTAMQELAKSARTDGALLEEYTSKAARNIQELTFLIDRAEKVLERFDNHISNGAMRLSEAQVTPAQAAHTQTTPQPELSAPTATPTSAQRPMNRPAQNTSASSQAAIMPGRYKKEMATPQNSEPSAQKPFKPTSFGASAAAYGSASTVMNNTTVDDTPAVASEAERELRRALGGV